MALFWDFICLFQHQYIDISNYKFREESQYGNHEEIIDQENASKLLISFLSFHFHFSVEKKITTITKQQKITMAYYSLAYKVGSLAPQKAAGLFYSRNDLFIPPQKCCS